MSISINFYRGYLAQQLNENTAAATIYVDRLTTADGQTVETTDFAEFGRGIITINPDGDGQSSYPECASFTAVNSGTVAFTGAIRGLDKDGVTDTDLMYYHPVGTPVVISFGVHNLQDFKAYIDDAIAAATIGTANVVTATAGETLATAGLGVYLKNDGKWWKWDADTIATIDGVQLGIAQGTASADGVITGGVMKLGRDTHQTGMTPGAVQYVSNTAGGISESAGTNSRAIGEARSSTELYFDPYYKIVPSVGEKAAMAGGGDLGTPSSTNKFVTEEGLVFSQKFGGDGSDGDLTISSGTTNIDIGGATTVVKNYESISITGTGVLGFTNPNSDGTTVFLKSKGNVTVTSSATQAIDLRSIGATGGAGGSNSNSGSNGSASSGQFISISNGGVGGVYPAGNSAAGGTKLDSSVYTISQNSLERRVIIITPGAGGGGGGSNLGGGGAADGGTGGRGGGALVIECAGALNFTGTINSSGSNGNNGQDSVNCSAGGGGGGSAGMVLIIYNTLIANSGVITATGGNGGNGGTGGGSTGDYGAGGGGGSTVRAAGGAGASGSAGSAPSTMASSGIGGGGGNGRDGAGAGGAGATGGTSTGGLVVKNEWF